jgi:WD40 repeat protein
MNNISINSTNRYICIGTENGFNIFSISPFKKVISRDIEGGVSVIKMLNESNIFLFVGRSETSIFTPNKFIVWDDNKKTILGEILYTNQIINIDVTDKYVFVQTEKKMYIYQFDNLQLLKEFFCGTAYFKIVNTDNTYLIYPTSNKGEIGIFNVDKDEAMFIQAHTTNISSIGLHQSGKYIATASERGTLIRIFNRETQLLMNELRRGTEITSIVQLEFHPDLPILLVGSIKGTIHLFNSEITENTDVPSNKLYNNYGISYVKFLLPEYFHSKWSFTTYTIENVKTINIFDKDKKLIYSVGYDGQFYECSYENYEKPIIEKVIKYVLDDDDPFHNRDL